MSAFRATYSDFKLIRSRRVVQVILEVPLEAADEAMRVLGGMPNPGSETWVGVARINPEHTRVEEPPASASSDAREAVQCQPAPDVGRPVRAPRKFEELAPAAQAGILCNEPAFHKFLSNYGYGQRLVRGRHRSALAGADVEHAGRHTRAEEPPASASSDAREAVQCQPASDVGRPARAKRKFEELPAAAQAGILCNEPAFQRFMAERHGALQNGADVADTLRRVCKITTRADIGQPEPAAIFRHLVGDYRAWMHV